MLILRDRFAEHQEARKLIRSIKTSSAVEEVVPWKQSDSVTGCFRLSRAYVIAVRVFCLSYLSPVLVDSSDDNSLPSVCHRRLIKHHL